VFTFSSPASRTLGIQEGETGTDNAAMRVSMLAVTRGVGLPGQVRDGHFQSSGDL